MLCTSGFVNEVLGLHSAANGPESTKMRYVSSSSQSCSIGDEVYRLKLHLVTRLEYCIHFTARFGGVHAFGYNSRRK